FDIRPSRGRFCVMIGYYPNEFRTIKELYPDATGFLCPPYLNAAGTSREPRWWKCKERESTANSLQDVLQCLDPAGLNWLSALRDRKFYAEQSDPSAAVPSGYAHELAGNIEIARERYREMNRRFEEIETRWGGIRKCAEQWRAFVFVRAKLAIEDALTAEIRK